MLALLFLLLFSFIINIIFYFLDFLNFIAYCNFIHSPHSYLGHNKTIDQSINLSFLLALEGQEISLFDLSLRDVSLPSTYFTS